MNRAQERVMDPLPAASVSRNQQESSGLYRHSPVLPTTKLGRLWGGVEECATVHPAAERGSDHRRTQSHNPRSSLSQKRQASSTAPTSLPRAIPSYDCDSVSDAFQFVIPAGDLVVTL